MAKHGEEVRDVLVRQRQAITAAVATIDLETPSRVTCWHNREVVAHLCLQPDPRGRPGSRRTGR